MGKPWTGAEEKWLKAAIAEGMDRVDICRGLGREKDTVRRKCFRLGIELPKAERDKDPPVHIQPASSLARSAKRLREACLDMFVREGNRRGLGMDDTMACILGPEPARRLDRHIHKTSSMQRQVNAVKYLSAAA